MNQTKFQQELISLLNKNSKENDSDTPDFILAEFIMDALNSFNNAVNARTTWYDKAEEFKGITPIKHKSIATINYVVGDATKPQGDGAKIIAHVCNDVGAWGAGFTIPLAKAFPKSKKEYRKLFQSGNAMPELGHVQFVANPSTNQTYIANIIGQRDIKPGLDGSPPIKYDALRIAFQTIVKAVNKADDLGTLFTIHMPKIGSKLAGGDWPTIAQIIQEELVDKKISVTVYELPHQIEYATTPDDPGTDTGTIDITVDGPSESQSDLLNKV